LEAGCCTYPSKKALASIVGRVRALTRRSSHPTLAALLRNSTWCCGTGAPTSATEYRKRPSDTSTNAPGIGCSDGSANDTTKRSGLSCSDASSHNGVPPGTGSRAGRGNVTLCKGVDAPQSDPPHRHRAPTSCPAGPDTADNIAHLVNELRVVADLEGVYQMRFEPERLPAPPHRGLREPGFFDHRRPRPVRGISGRALQRRDGHRLELLIGDRAAHHGGDGR
jgi:hypothetical protein